jgi:hypothetical protein
MPNDQTPECKHCGLRIAGGVGAWHHIEGPQTGKNTCAINPYGFDAAPHGELCNHTCYEVWGRGNPGV